LYGYVTQSQSEEYATQTQIENFLAKDKVYNNGDLTCSINIGRTNTISVETNNNSVAIGANNEITGETTSIAIGQTCKANNTYAIAMGNSTFASGECAVALGPLSSARREK
jgi:hypothetical protein